MKEQHRGVWGVACVLFTASVGCAAARPLPVLRASDPTTLAGLHPGDSFVMEFDQGETIPLSFAIHGQFIETPPDSPSLKLVAKQHFFLRVEGGRFTANLDGVHFGEKKKEPGRFFIGFVPGPDGRTTAKIDIETPVTDMGR